MEWTDGGVFFLAVWVGWRWWWWRCFGAAGDGGVKKNEGQNLCKVFLIREKEALYANLLTCVFSASATLVLCKRKVTFFTSFSIMKWLFLEAPVSVLRLIGSSYLVYIMLCNVSFNFVSITPNHFFFKQQIAFVSFVG